MFSPSYAIPQNTAVQSELELVNGVNPLQLTAYVEYLADAVGFDPSQYGVTLPPYPSGDPKEPIKWQLNLKKLRDLNVAYLVSDYPLNGLELANLIAEDPYIYHVEESRPRAWMNMQNDSSGSSVKLVEWTPNRIVVRAQGPGRLVLSEIVYPGWQAEMDGQIQDIASEQGTFRSVDLPHGEHVIQFHFRPISVYLGLAISMITLLGMFFVLRKR